MSLNNIERFIKSRKVEFRSHSYVYDENDLSVETIADKNGWKTENIFKTLMLEDVSGNLIVTVISGIHHLDRKKVAMNTKRKKVQFIPVSKLLSKTGFVRGACSPIIPHRKVQVLIDEFILTKPSILVNAGERGKLLELAAQDLVDLCNAQVVDIVADYSE